MIMQTLLIASILVQLAAVLMAARLIALTGRRIVWILIAGALTLMIVRRGIPLVRILSGDSAIRTDLNTEVVALIISLLMLIGISMLVSIFKEIKLSEDKQAQSAREWQGTFDASQDAIWILDSHNRILQSNKKAEAFFHLTPEQMIGRPYREILDKTIPRSAQSAVSASHPGDGRESTEIQIESAWYLITRNPILDQTGRQTGAVFIVSDITAQKQTLETLRKSEARLRSVLDSMMEGCQILDKQWRYVYLNRPAEIHARRPKEELLGNAYLQLWPGSQNTAVFELMKRVMHERDGQRLRNEFIYPDGEHGWFDLSILPVPEGILILSIDVTQSKQAQEALTNERNLYKDLVASQPAGVYRLRGISPNVQKESDWVEDVENNYRLEMISDRFCNILGATREDCQANASIVVDRIHPDDRTDFIRQNVAAVAEAKRFEWEGRLNAEANAQWVYFASVPRKFSNGDIVWTGILLDISERKRAEEQLKQINDQLEQRINERTAELKDAIIRLEELNRVFVGRELKMTELKQQIAVLEAGKNQPE